MHRTWGVRHAEQGQFVGGQGVRGEAAGGAEGVEEVVVCQEKTRGLGGCVDGAAKDARVWRGRERVECTVR